MIYIDILQVFQNHFLQCRQTAIKGNACYLIVATTEMADTNQNPAILYPKPGR